MFFFNLFVQNVKKKDHPEVLGEGLLLYRP